MKVKILFAAILALTILSCRKLEEGKVIAKIYEAEESNLLFMPVSTGKTITMIPYFIHDGEDFIIQVEGVHNGKKRIEKWYVTEAQYRCLIDGDSVRFGRDCSREDMSYKKTRQ